MNSLLNLFSTKITPEQRQDLEYKLHFVTQVSLAETAYPTAPPAHFDDRKKAAQLLMELATLMQTEIEEEEVRRLVPPSWATNVGIFRDRFDRYHKGHYSNVTWSDFGGEIKTLFPTLSKINFDIGSIHLGQCGDEVKIQYCMIFTKVGAVMVYENTDGSFHYFCDESFAVCSTALGAGFGQTSGPVETVEQLNHFFAISDSYLN